MELSPDFVGTKLKEFTRKITWRETMNYAAAIDDDNSSYFDDETNRGLIAPSMFATALTWGITGKIWEFMEAENFPMEILMTQVHYTEHIKFHRTIKPGDSLAIKGSIAAILPHRTGTHVVIHYRARDKEGHEVFSEYTGAIMRGVKCLGEGRGVETLPAVPECEGDNSVIWERDVFIDKMRPYIYDGCTEIVFPIHTSKKFARQAGLPGIILQGTATLAFAVRELVNSEAGGKPDRLKEIFCRFSGMVLPGTGIRVVLIGKDRKQGGNGLHFFVVNDAGEKALSNGYAFIGDG